MIRGLYTAASGMITKQAEQDNLSNDIANINTPGYKKSTVSVKSFEKLMVENKDKYAGNSSFKNELGKMEFGVGVDEVSTDYSQGILNETGRNLDFAVNGSGYFTVIDNRGNMLYTRNGRFSIDDNGYLVTAEGYKVLGISVSSNKSPIKVTDPDFKIDSQGNINSANGKVKFCISKFNNENSLIKEGTSYFKSGEKPQISNAQVKQGTIEKSNLDMIDAVTQLISIQRGYESNQRVIQQIDETLGKTVNEVGSLK